MYTPDLNTPEGISYRKYLERLVAEIERDFPRRPYGVEDNISDIMYVEGGQKVINYIKKKYRV